MAVLKRRDKWAYRFKVSGETYFKSGFGTAREAEEAESKLRSSLFDPNTFAVMASKRLEYVKAYCSDKHRQDTIILLRPFIAEWGDMPIASITRLHVKEMLLALSRRMSNNNVNKHLRAIRTLFQSAVDDGIIGKNPTAGMKFLPHHTKVKKLPEIADIQEALVKMSAEDRAYLRVILGTGARISEINTLTWDHVDFHNGVVTLLTHKSKGGHSKTRKVPMTSQVKDELKFMFTRREKESPWVFTNRVMMYNYPENPEVWRYKYRSKLLKDAPFTYHDLRHCAASLLVGLGVDLGAVQRILGHSRLSTTDRYIKSIPSNVVDGIRKLEEYLEGV